uniref:RING-type E3 ubiquitin transferase n=1 Tax=Kalanchoe fedtschenkoi TaxID=63787 RepID=A0A7N0RJJ9_KALFE
MPDMGNMAAAEVTGRIMVAAIIILFLVVIFVLFLHLYAKWFWWQTEEDVTNPAREARRRRRFVFTPGQENAPVSLKRGLDPSVLRSLQVLVFNPSEHKDGLECAVCLCELVEGDSTRMLPKCNHGFHVDCIDMWFQSHSTCPLCRNPVAPESGKYAVMEVERGPQMTALDDGIGNVPAAAALNAFTTESLSYPTNVLFWGNEVQVSSGANGGEEASNVASTPNSATRLDEMLVLDIPRHVSENSSSPSPSGMRFGEEEQKLQLPTRLRTLKRLLSRDRRVIPSSSSSSDVEQGMSRS